MPKKPRVLLIADADSVFTIRFIRDFLLPEGYNVVVFPIWKQPDYYASFYADNHIPVYVDKHTLPIIRHIPKLRMWVRIWCNALSLRAYGPFDIVHNHQLSQRDLALGYLVSHHDNARFIANFWGSDLATATPKRLASLTHYLCKADVINVFNPNYKTTVAKTYGTKIEQKTTVVPFGLPSYETIDTVQATHTREDCKAHFAIAADQYVVCIGYNASPIHQQLAVLETLATLPSATREKMTFVLQQTYGISDTAYVQKTRERAKALGNCLILTEFMDATESAFLRCACDLFIHAIVADSFSASLQEYCYAGAHIIMGSWLNYPQLDALDITIARFTAIDAIVPLVMQAYQNKIPSITAEQRKQMSSHYSWDGVRDGWLALYGKSSTEAKDC